jgi:hypothetical protein
MPVEGFAFSGGLSFFCFQLNGESNIYHVAFAVSISSAPEIHIYPFFEPLPF